MSATRFDDQAQGGRLAGARWAGAVALALLAGLGGAGVAQAATYNVTRSDDPDAVACASPAGGCSLREALVAVNAAPSPPDVINLPAGNYSDDRLIEFPIGRSVSILGAGSRTTVINGSSSSRVFALTGTSVVVSISGVTITGGHAGTGLGGGIYAENGLKELSLAGVALSGNTADAAGGLEAVAGQVRIRDTLVSGNLATGAAVGGLDLGGSSAVLTNVTVTGNSAPANGALGGGIFSSPSGVARIANSTIAGNSVGPGGYGGNLFGGFKVRNSIIAGGVGSAGSENCQNALTSEGYNLEDRNQCFATLSGGDQVNTNPLLGPLAGGPDASSTLALLAGSPAINAGNPAGCKDAAGALVTHDQRGVARPQGAACDIGAFEFQAPAGAATITGDPSPGRTLTCNPTLASPDGPVSATTYAWLREGTPIAAGQQYTPNAADLGRLVACAVSATNAAASASLTSAPVRVTTPGGGGPGGAGAFKLTGKHTTKDGTLVLTLTAPGPGVFSALAQTQGASKASAAKHKKQRAGKHAKRVTYATGAATATKAGTLTLTMHPTSKARRLLATGKRLALTLTVTYKPTTGQATTTTTHLTVKLKKTGKKHH